MNNILILMDQDIKMEPILFYEKDMPYYEFSNFYKSNIVIDGVTFMDVEHYFQAQKFYIPDSEKHMEYYSIICTADTPMKVKMLGCQNKKMQFSQKWTIHKKKDTRLVVNVIDQYKDINIRPDWDTIREDIMKKGLTAKFTQHQHLKELLLSTEDAVIIENSPRDNYWGNGKNKDGQNRLGYLIMEVREELKSTSN